MHDTPHCSEQTHIRAYRADSGKERKTCFKFLHLAGQGNLHGSVGNPHDHFLGGRIPLGFFVEFDKLTET